MAKKTTLLLCLTLSLSFNSISQSEDYGTYTIYKNPKRIELFTNEKLKEIKETIEEKRSDYKQVVWSISDYTYVIIEPRNGITEQINTLKK